MSRTGLLAALAVAALISGCGDQGSAPPGSAAATSTEAVTLTPGVNATDRAFAYGMLAQRPHVDHLVQLARTNSGNPMMVAMADTLAVSEQQQSETINALLVQWTDGQEGGQGPPPPGPTLFDRGAVERLGQMQGPEFDKLWLQVMLNHHQAVMTMASSEIREGEDINAKTLAQAIITTRQEEIVHMQQLMGGIPR